MVTSPLLVRATRALALALAAAPFAAGCATTRGSGRPGDAVGGAVPAMGAAPVRAEARLDNGIQVVIEENHVAPLVAIQVWVAAGAADDPPALAGAAHLYEHLVLRGGARRAPGGGVREIEAVRGSAGAWTGLDETVYHAVVAAPFFELGLDVLADALAKPNFDPAEVERARRLALDEIAGAAADPRLRASQALFAAAFAGQRHARPVMGTAASVAALTPAALASRFAETHGGAAMTVVVVGDVDAGAISAVKRAFGAIPRGRAPVAAEGVPAPRARVTVTSGAGAPPEIVLGFRTAKLGVKEVAALDLLAAVLARGEGARLPRELVRNRQLADGVRPFSFRSREAGLLAVALTPAPRRIAPAVEAALDLLLRAALEPASPDELEAARAALESDLARAGEGPLARARRLGFAAAITRDSDDPRQYLEAIRTAGPAELQEIAGKILNVDHLTLAVALPDATPAGRDETVAALTPRLEAMVMAAPALADKHATARAPAVGAGDAVRFVTPAGARVLVLSDGSAPLVSVQAAWVDRGDGLETAGDDAAPIIAALLERGTRTRSAGDVAAEVQAIGGTVKGFVAPGTLGLRADFLPQHLGRGLALVADCLARPAFSEAELDGAQRVALTRTREDARAGDPASRAALRLFGETLSPDAGRRAEGDPPPALGRFALLDRYRRRYPLSRLVVAVVGNVDPAAVAAALTNAFAGGAPDAPTAPPAPPAAVAPATVAAQPAPAATSLPLPPPAPTTVFRASAGVDSAAVVGYSTFAPADPNRPSIEVLAEILAGEGGRLASALSDERTAACRTGARVAPPAARGYLAISVTCPPARLDAGVAAVRAALAQVVSGGVTPDEVTRATRRLVGARAGVLRTRMAVADALVRDEGWGLPMLSYRRASAPLARVTAADVARAAQAALDPRREIIAVTHPPSAAPALARTSSGGR